MACAPKWLLDNEFYKSSPVEPGPAEAPRRGGLEEAIEAFTKVIEIAKRQCNRGVEADTLTRRLVAYGQLGDWERAARGGDSGGGPRRGDRFDVKAVPGRQLAPVRSGASRGKAAEIATPVHIPRN